MFNDNGYYSGQRHLRSLLSGLKRLQVADHKERFDIIIQKLRDNGHKITPQRLAIVKILAKSEGHPSVENIHARIKKDFPTMSLATVYKNIRVKFEKPYLKC
jgi:hypothetical protein